MTLSIVRATPGAPPNVSEAVEAAHARLHHTRCQGWMLAAGRRPVSPYGLDVGTGQVATAKLTDPKPSEACEFHPVQDGDR